MSRVWDELIDRETRQRYERAGYGRPAGFGDRPAVLLVDLFLTDLGDGAFADPPPPGIESHITAIQRLAAEARARRLPVFYTNDRFEADGSDLGGWRHKSWAAPGLARKLAGRPCPWLEAVAPESGDRVIYKQRPSAFFGTALASDLIDLGVDTLVVGGQTTSGCVRATVVDAFSYGFRTIVVEDCTYDRCAPSHKINLFDMHQKYADVISLADALSGIGARAETTRS